MRRRRLDGEVDSPSSKGGYARGLGVLDRVTGGAYTTYLERQAASAYANNRNSIDAYGPHWAGPSSTPATSTSTAPWTC